MSMPGLPPSPPPRQPPAPRRIGDATIAHDYYPDAFVTQVPGYRELTLDLLRPVADDVVPVVVWIHGGAYLTGTHRAMPFPLLAGEIDERLLAAGFAVARISYRFSAEARFPAQLLDVRAAIRWVRRYAAELRLDASRVAVWGESAGGHLAALACLAANAPFAGDTETASSVDVQAGVIWYAPSDFLTMTAQSGADSVIDHDAPDSPESLLLGAPVQEAVAAARAASSVVYAHAGAPPMLIVHGGSDHVVPVGQSEQLHKALLACGANSQLTVVPGADHCFAGSDLEPLVSQAISFLKDALRSGSATRPTP